MRKLVLGLAASTVIFGSSAVYLWRELQLERAARQELAAVRSTPAPVTTALPAARVAAPMRQSSDGASNDSKVAVLSPDSPDQRGHSRRLLKMLRDPAGRDEIYPEVDRRMSHSRDGLHPQKNRLNARRVVAR
jgi:hypothetical protein